MKRKMDLLERAHGLLCNAPSDGTSAEDAELWHKLRAEWIERWSHLIRDQRTKEHNKRIQIGNDAITRYEQQAATESPVALDGTPPTVAQNWRVVSCPSPAHGVRAVDLNGAQPMCPDCRVVGPDGEPLRATDGLVKDPERTA